MGSVRYTIVEGEVLSENRNGVKRDYVPDPLGSTIALLDNTQVQTDTRAYWPYGEVASNAGPTDLRYGYVGTLGYYRDDEERVYVRARELHAIHARWMTSDPIGFRGGDFNLYRYTKNSPANVADPSGKGPIKIAIAILGIHDTACLLWAAYDAWNIQNTLRVPHEKVDKLEHCYAYCLALLCSFTKFPIFVPRGTEQLPGTWQPGESPNDIIANKEGINCGLQNLNWWRCLLNNPAWGLIGYFGGKIDIRHQCMDCCYNKSLDQRIDHDPPYQTKPF